MKSLLVILFLFTGLVVHAQSKIDSDLSDFLEKRNYIQLTDTAHLPKSILPYLHLIIENISAKNYAAPADVYIEATYMRDNQDKLIIPIIDLIGIKFIKHEYDSAPKVKDTVINGGLYETLPPMSLGNPAGRERELEVNKADGRIVTYITQ